MLDKNRHKLVEKPDSERVVRSMRTLMREKEEDRRHKRNSVISYAACAFMASVLVVTGVNLVKSYEKMKRIDSSINSIVKEVSNLNTKETEQTVQEDVVPVNVIYETKATIQATQVASQNQQETTAKNSATETESAVQASSDIQYKKYIVQKGDTILGIAKKNYGSTEKAAQIIDINNLTDANKLYVGQEIKLP